MKKAPSSQHITPQVVLTALQSLILLLILAACGPPPTPNPTDIPPPTATPDPNVDWPEFVDPWGRYSVHYPPDWHAFPAVLETPGYASTISTINIGAASEPSREVDVSGNEFAIWFTFSRADAIEGMDLMVWVEGRLHPGGDVVQRTQETVAGAPAVIEILRLHHGQRAKIVHFSTSNGILSIFGQPWGNPESELFDLLLTTVSFQ